MVKALAVRHDVLVVGTTHPEMTAVDVPGLIEVPRPPDSERWRRLARLVGLLKGRTTWWTDWRSPEFERIVGGLPNRCDIIHVEFVVLADALGAGSRSRARVIVTDHDPPIVAALNRLREARGGWRIYRALEVAAWHRTYRRASRLADLFVVFNENDRDVIADLVTPTPIVVQPFPVVIPERRAAPVPRKGPPRVGFTGSYHRPPNINAGRRLVERIMPLVWESDPTVEVSLIGRDANFDYEADPRVRVTGYVDDLIAELDTVSLLVMPIDLGGGMRVKVIEALALGRVVIGSELAAAGLPDELRRHVVIRDSDRAMADAVVDLLTDPGRLDDMATDAMEAAHKWLDPESGARRYDELYEVLDELGRVTSQ